MAPTKKDQLETKLGITEKLFMNVYNKCATSSPNASACKMYLEEINQLFNDFKDTHIELQCKYPTEDSNASDIQMSELHEKFISLKVALSMRIDEYMQSSVPNNSNNTNSAARTESVKVKLPTIDLPQFDGDLTKWIQFRDRFKSLVHDRPELTGSTKMHYLKSAIKDKNCIINSLPETDDAYNQAWEDVLKQYNNKRLIMRSHFDAIFTLKRIFSTEATIGEVKTLFNELNNNIAALKRAATPDILFEALMAHQAEYRLNKEIKVLWEQHNDKEIPTWNDMKSFLEKHIKMLENISTNKSKPKSETTSTKALISKPIICQICKQANHEAWRCESFLALNPLQRVNKVESLKLCLNCFGNHANIQCTSKYRCKSCNGFHNSLLHQPVNSVEISNETPPPITTTSAANYRHQRQRVLLSTAIVNVKQKNGSNVFIRALLDSGAESCYITESAAVALGLPRIKTYMEVSGIGNRRSFVKSKCNVQISSRFSNFAEEFECLIVKDITANIPSSKIDRSQLNIPTDIQLADESFDVPGRIDLLIGNNLFLQMLTGQTVKLSNGIVMSHTQIGWILGGSIQIEDSNQKSHCLVGVSNLQSLKSSIEQFWKIENYESCKKFMTEEEAHCEEHFQQTYTRLENGAFMVNLPTKPNMLSQLKDNYKQAEQRFFQLEKRLTKNDTLKQQYIDFMNEYRTLGHMDKIVNPENLTEPTVYYLPHHPVFKLDSSTTKMRTVFDASAKTMSGVSLNDALCIGPQIQSDSFTTSLRFRQPEIVIKVDIGKMYRTIKIFPEQRQLQRIIWREKPSDPLEIYELNTVTYGTSSASFLATRCLKQLAIDNTEKYPRASECIQRDFYVDDLITGARTIEEASQLQAEIHNILASAQMTLRKYSSNSSELIREIPEEYQEIPDEHNQLIKALGINWNVKTDEITFNLKPMTIVKVTKRNCLSAICKHYDPDGLTGPVTLNLKRFMKKIYQSKAGWDEPLALNIVEEWKSIAETITILNEVRVPRQVFSKNYISANMIGFCDASTVGYGAVIYIQSSDSSGNFSSNILCSKSRIAPDEVKTVARLELCSCLMLSELINRCMEALPVRFDNVIAFSDSEIALYWIKRSPTQLKTFVANRVNQIQENSKFIKWKHISGEINPADHISRGLTPNELINCVNWWHGPEFLKQPLNEWPKSSIVLEPIAQQYTNEFKQTTALIAHNESTERNVFITLMEKNSDHRRVLRIINFVIKFIIMKCIKESKNIQPPDAPSLNEKEESQSTALSNMSALDVLVRAYQKELFPAEFTQLSNGKIVAHESKLKNLNPFFDTKRQIIRVGGRLRNANGIDSNQIHPILMSKCHLMNVIIKETHEENFHTGQQATLCLIRQRFWLVNGKQSVRQILHNCIKCIRANPQMKEQFMGSLPMPRINESPTFYHCGVDFAGPFNMKTSTLRNAKSQKCYFSIFVCFATKAVHIEIVSELTSKAFIAALDRFFSIRGQSKFLYSDNGTNFVGADNIFHDIQTLVESQQNDREFLKYLQRREITWSRIPPRAPQFGGLWEAAVKSAKHHMKRVVGETILTYEELSTLMHKIQAILNSRPLTSLSNDPNDMQALTPGHFLIGRPLVSIPEFELSNTNINRLPRWDRVISMQQQFWKRWHVEYLNQLQTYKKNFKEIFHYEIDQIVILKKPDCPPLHWPLGRITKLHPGNDGIVRVITVFNGLEEQKIPTFNVCPLPITHCDDSIEAAEDVEIQPST